ncbi:MAG: hypothetical protein RR906_01745 [Acetivibrio sp.]
MKKGILGIFDYELSYSNRLMEYMNQKEDFLFEVCVFTTIENLVNYLKERSLEALLLNEEALSEEICFSGVKNLIILSEGTVNLARTEHPIIEKYQSAEKIIQDLYACVEGISVSSMTKVYNPSPVEFIGVISPKGGSGKTTFSMALGKICGRVEKVLYISFEQLGSSLGVKEETKGLSDLIYYLKQRKRGLMMVIQSLGVDLGGVDCILSVTHYEDLQSVEREDIDYLISELSKTQIYKKVIFDIGFLNEIAFHILERCNLVYVTYLQKDAYLEKERAFRTLFRFEEKEELMERFIEINLPKDNGIIQGTDTLHHLLDGELGVFVEKLVEKDAG